MPGSPLYQFVPRPFEFRNVSQAMCRLMNKVIPPHLLRLLMISETINDHLQTLFEIFSCIQNANLIINVEKSRFLQKQVKYLGHIIGHGIIQTDTDEVQAIRNYPLQKSVRQLRRFLAVCGRYSHFVRNFESLSPPLTDVLNNTKFYL